jgi:hypothetical protein
LRAAGFCPRHLKRSLSRVGVKGAKKITMIKHLFLIVAFLLFTNHVFGCSLITSPISDFDATHYIFIGEVIEVIESVKYESQGIKADAVGLKIKVFENVYSPKPASYFEVFPLRLTPSCGLMSDKEEIRKHYPIGSQVRVVAKEATVFKNQPVNSIVRLETSIYNKGSIARNDLNENLRTTAKTVYDYKSFVEKQGTIVTEDALFDSNDYLPVFELRKDLFRLKESKSEDERTKILERLVFYPHVHNMNFPIIARTYLKNQNKLSFLEKQWEHRVKEIYSKRQ